MRPHEVIPNGRKNHNVRANSDQKSRNESDDKRLGINTNHSQGLGGFSLNEDMIDEYDRVDFSGIGPKGYERPTKLIFQEACEALWSDREVDASHIEVSVEEGVVSLKGQVLNREMKRKAEVCVEKVSGVVDVMNELRILGSGNHMSDPPMNS